MTDEELISRFEDCSLSKDGFHHREHVRLAWLYLHKYSLVEALTRFSEGIKRFAASIDKAGLYHETITWSYIFLINERINCSPGQQDWNGFVEANADLLDWKTGPLEHYYTEERLNSELARRTFLLPDRCSRLPRQMLPY